MNNFIKNPNLPDKRVSLALIGEHREIAEGLSGLGVECIFLADSNLIDYSVRNHADIAACYIGDGTVILDKNRKGASDMLQSRGIQVVLAQKAVCGAYPGDVPLNCAIIGHNLIYYKRGIEPEIMNRLTGMRQFPVNQGYCRCSVCPVTEKAIITDDVGIYRSTCSEMDVLLIEKGDILLEGKPYGFIGGASTKIDKDKLLFFGDIETHRNSDEILRFIRSHGVEHISLCPGKLRDIGGIIPLMTE